MIKKILGMDISSSVIGWCLLQIDDSNKKIEYINSGTFEPIKGHSIIERLANTRDKILKIIEQNDPDYIGIEDIIQFIRGKSSANTVITLSVFNRMIGLLSFDFLQKKQQKPELFGVLAIRHGLKLNKKFPKKEEMPELVSKHLGIKFPYKYIVKGKSKGKVHITNYDRADAMAVALYYAMLLIGKKKINKKVIIK